MKDGKEPETSVDRKLEAVREAVEHRFPTSDIEHMLAEIERGYGVDTAGGSLGRNSF